MSCDDDYAGEGCGELMLERIRYFTGRHMSAQDFRDADAYHRSFRHLHNRILHGWGIACGLDVRLHPRPECRGDRVVVRCGMAIDCCGREVIVPKDVVSGRIPWSTRPKEKDGAQDREYVLVLCLKYQSTRTHKVPVLYSATACATPEFEYGRVREDYRLCWEWLKRSDLGRYGWRTAQRCPPPNGDEKDQDRNANERDQQDPKDQKQTPPAKPEQDQDRDPCADDDRCCLKPDCAPDHCVILAMIRAKNADALDEQADILTSGRRSIAQAREHLTHICWTSWEHGGFMRSRDLKTLQVRFDRPLADAPSSRRYPRPRGISWRTFMVQTGGPLEDLDFVRYRTPPSLSKDRRTAIFEPDDYHELRGETVHVTIECDFLLDCHGNPVDGDHLGGRLPSGNGLPGGTFHSWFSVVTDEKYQEAEEERRAASPAEEES
jgi:hypothetical protein